MPKVTKRIAVPHDVPLGALIGRGGCVQTNIRRAHFVSSWVDVDTRHVVLSGAPNNVDAAQADVYAIIRAVKEQNEAMRHPGALDGMMAALRATSIRSHATGTFTTALKDGDKFVWWMQECPDDIARNAVLAKHPFRLRKMGDAEDASWSDEEEQELTLTGPAWIELLDDEFIAHMKQQVAALVDQDVRVKASIGMTYFSLRSAKCHESLRWSELRALRVPDQLGERWVNEVQPHCTATTRLLARIQDKMDEDTAPTYVLTVFVQQSPIREAPDIVVKYHKQGDTWVVHRAPCFRTVHQVFNVLLDEETAFRFSFCSRRAFQSSPVSEASQYIAVPRLDEDATPFDIDVHLTDDAPRGWTIREFSVRAKHCVDLDGLHWTVQYLDAMKTRTRMHCRRVGAKSLTASRDGPEEIEALTRELQDVLTA